MIIRMSYKFLGMALIFLCLPSLAVSETITKGQRFFHSGDGHIRLSGEKNGKRFNGRYRGRNGYYDDKAYGEISSLFGAPYLSRNRVLSLRLIEFLDFLEDRLGPDALLTITSGYRPPAYNTNLRKRGALAAKASLHQYGMAADFTLEGVPSKQVWHYVRSLGFGGTGYYHGRTVHVDVGPARFWDEKSSGVDTGLSDGNKLIGLVTNYDIYRSGDAIQLRFIRMTAFPIQVYPEFELISQPSLQRAKAGLVFKPQTKLSKSGKCLVFNDISQMASLRWSVPKHLTKGRYRIRARFCGDEWENMPDQVFTPEFEIRLE